jgi:hypothetical protein
MKFFRKNLTDLTQRKLLTGAGEVIPFSLDISTKYIYAILIVFIIWLTLAPRKVGCLGKNVEIIFK